MNLRGLQSIALLLWGFHTDLLWFAIPMAIIWETRFFWGHRWALTKKDFYQIADLTSLVLVGILVFLFVNRGEYHFVRTLISWLPILFFPLVILLGYSTTNRMSLDILFYSLRRQKQPVNQSWNMDYILFGLCLIAAGTNTDAASYYFPVATALVGLAFLRIRSRRYSGQIWFLFIALTFLMAFGVQLGIRESHQELRKRAQVWLATWIQQRTNPLKTHTAIGSVGRLKASDRILFRVRAEDGGPVPALLREAAYDLPIRNDWSISDPIFSTILPVDDYLWALKPPGRVSGEKFELEIFKEFDREIALVPVPSGVTVIQDLPAGKISRNPFGTIKAEQLIPSPIYHVQFMKSGSLMSAPTFMDTTVPPPRKALMERVVRENQLSSDNAIASVKRYFASFRYSLYQDEARSSDPLGDFLLIRNAGHCEYFAASTALLLRELGVPARYVVGYSVQEYDPISKTFVVRQRHAHAWVSAYVDGRWQVVDTTPSQWESIEAEQATLLRPILDVFSNLRFVFLNWWNNQKLEDYQIPLFIFGAILTLILIWRISRSEQVKVEEDVSTGGLQTNLPGSHSPFFKLLSSLEEAGFGRSEGETLLQWIKRIDRQQLAPLSTLHNRWRFDPEGLGEKEQTTLREGTETELAKIESSSISTSRN